MIYTLTGSGSGTLSTWQLVSSNTGGGTWSASSTLTITLNPATITPGTPQVVLGSYSASSSIAACGVSLPARTTYGAVIEEVAPDGTAGLILVQPDGLPLWPVSGTTDKGVSGLLVTGGQVFGSLTQVTGGITITSSLEGAGSDGQPLYMVTGSGSGTLPCSLLNPGLKGSGSWNISVSSQFTLSPDPATLVTSGGSVSGTYSGFTGPASSSCGSGKLNPIDWGNGPVSGTVYPGGGITLYFGPPS